MKINNIFYKLIIIFALVSQTLSRIIVVADIHADIHKFKRILKDAKVIDKHDNWIAEKNTSVIQLGDQIDAKYPIHKTYEYEMLYFTEELRKMAENNNSTFISLIGNHELINIDKIKRNNILKNIIASRPILYKKDRYIYCHGMFNIFHYRLMKVFNITINDLNSIWSRYVLDIPQNDKKDEYLLQKLVFNHNSILYNRIPDNLENINYIFNNLQVDYLFVGHTITDNIHMKNKIWYLDLLLNDAFEKSSYNYIQIKDNDIIIKHLTK